jgi:hypothetical protein
MNAFAALFEASSSSIPQAGGRGRTWRAGELIIKPLPDDAEAAELADLVQSPTSAFGPGLSTAGRVRGKLAAALGCCAAAQ